MSFLKKAKSFLDKHDKQVDQALDKIGDEVDKRTHHKYTGAIDGAVDQAQKRTGDGATRPEAGR
jgi:MT0933-like antitoxin protein